MLGLLTRKPRGLGVVDGKLAAVPRSPNCVSSQADSGDRVHFVEPFRFEGDAETAWKRLVEVVKSQPRVRVTEESGTYLHAECTTRLMRYVDDLEFLLRPAEGRIDVRSASRIGRTDFGVNRKRVEGLRREFGGR